MYIIKSAFHNLQPKLLTPYLSSHMVYNMEQHIKLYLTLAWSSGVISSFLLKPMISIIKTFISSRLKAKEALDLEKKAQEHRLTLTEVNYRYKLSMASLDKRLEVHQDAFSRWWKLMGASKEENKEICRECQEWWAKHCVYLTPEARNAFSDAYHAAWIHFDLINSKNTEAIEDNWSRLREAGSIILKSIQLPDWPSPSETELKSLQEPKG